MIIDCHSGDDHGVSPVETAAALSLETDRVITLVGDAPSITRVLTHTPCDIEMIHVVHSADEGPWGHLRRACRVAGDSGSSLVTAAPLTTIADVVGEELSLLDGCSAPTAVEIIPVLRGPEDTRSPFAFLCDAGLSTKRTPEDFPGLAQLASAYAAILLQAERPTLSMLCRTEDIDRLTADQRATNRLLEREEYGYDYVGLTSADRVFQTESDILLTDGYTGGLISDLVASALSSGEALVERSRTGLRQRLGIRALANVLNRLRHFADSETYGGAAVIGHQSPILAVPPNASDRAWRNAVILASEWQAVSLGHELTVRLNP